MEALKNGVYDDLTKPIDFGTLRLTSERVLELKRLKETAQHLNLSSKEPVDQRHIITRSTLRPWRLNTVT